LFILYVYVPAGEAERVIDPFCWPKSGSTFVVETEMFTPEQSVVFVLLSGESFLQLMIKKREDAIAIASSNDFFTLDNFDYNYCFKNRM
jgi:hypothetical protein